MPPSEHNIRGVKRKRQDDKESEEDKEAKLHKKLASLSILKYRALRELRKVSKKAKTFEVQKTLKKLKDARCKDPESDLTKDLGSQMELLKHLDYDQLARSALVTKLKKNKILSAHPSIRALLAELASNPGPPGIPGTLTAKVQSRILSSKIIASEVALIVDNLRTFLHPSVGLENIGKAAHNPHPSPDVSKRTMISHKRDASSSKDEPFGRGSDRGSENTSNNEAIDDEWESGTVGGSSGSDDSPLNLRLSEEEYAPGSADGHDDATFDQGSGSSDDSSGNLKTAWQPRGPKGQSEFLPSLSAGFTRGDSGSEFSDRETRLMDGNKKNRRGQRARRAIWEKKFGKNANHIKKQPQAERPRRRSDPVDRRSGKGTSFSRPYPTLASRSTHDYKPSLPVSDERVNNSGWTRSNGDRDLRGRQDRPFHPSWEAKRKHKVASIVPSQGTKIVFSES